MAVGVRYRISKGVSVYYGGGGAVATALAFEVLGGFAQLLLATLFAALIVVVFFIGYFVRLHMTSRRLEELKQKAIAAGTLVPDGNYTVPRSWGVYRVEIFANGVRGDSYHLGNHPVRQHELQRERGAVEVIAVFTSRTDAEEMKFLLNSGRVTSR